MALANRPTLIGLTGGIGAGKSTVARILASYGLPVLDTDRIGHELLDTTPIRDVLSRHFGKEIVNEGIVDRAYLAQVVFTNPDALRFLNNTLHPAILQVVQDQVEHSPHSLLVIEVPLLFEAGLSACFDAIIYVSAPEDVRIARICGRGNETSEQAKARIQNQWPEEEKRGLADLVVENACELTDLEEQIKQVVNRLQTTDRRDTIPFNRVAG
jgi:dephospho-CoA kinase